ncbi:hypothetical protein HANVADRAFT_49539 [Hanseniaspora valbyensis NRRL Y-1626]|uniref:Uncharacterized protein n=1 Tax=Hanseniaspora valbyensis NRRL Y-1626 TaxID=766949 RepID=A0A1B7TBD7_9ASCO|nr:hypothetical protein HANVADRAFT_49539 [Hanseniaspora valbyensis NRRL Y-1626]
MDFENLSLSSNDSDVEENIDFLNNKEQKLNNLLLAKKTLEDTILKLSKEKEERDLLVSQIDDNTINNFINILQDSLSLDIITDSFIKESIQLDNKNFELVLFDCDFLLEDVVSAAVNLETIQLERWEDINILFLKLQSYYHLRSSIFTQFQKKEQNINLILDLVYGSIKDENGNTILQWDILVADGGLLVQNKLTTPIIERQSLLKQIICKKGIYEGIPSFIQQY